MINWVLIFSSGLVKLWCGVFHISEALTGVLGSREHIYFGGTKANFCGGQENKTNIV